ncbi:MAG: DnaJ domain-containing protein [Candidatus Microthrix parvicella]
MTHYEVVGARASDDAPTMRRAYLAEVRRSHPDVGPPTARAAREARMRELNAAWAVLSDDDKRAAYDAQLRGGDRSFSAGRHGAATSRPERPFRPLHPDDDDTGWREESDVGVPGTEVHPALQFIPIGLGAAAILTLLSSFVIHNDRMIGLAVVFGFLAGISFLLVPLLAMLAGARAERSSSHR